ncbi:MAG: trimethylamine methyltransferase family protein, partial [Planctomycetes bacterium]|nr:trimethylamine methyltransferase family protein [Planctomycetota bacterium]
DYAWRIGRGLGWEDTPTGDIVSEGRRDGTFLMHPSTMRFREEIWDPGLFTHEGFNQWTAQGAAGLIEKAAATAEERIEANTYRPDGDVRKALDRILAIAEKDLA